MKRWLSLCSAVVFSLVLIGLMTMLFIRGPAAQIAAAPDAVQFAARCYEAMGDEKNSAAFRKKHSEM